MTKRQMEKEILSLRREIGEIRQILGRALELAEAAHRQSVLTHGDFQMTIRDGLRSADQLAARALDLAERAIPPKP